MTAQETELSVVPEFAPADLAEMAALGIVIDVPERAAQLFARVPVSEFTGPRLNVAEAIHGLRVARKPIDAALVLAELQRRGTLSRVGGMVYLHTLQRSYTTPLLLDGYIDEIVKEIRRRKIWAISARGAHLTTDRTQDPVQIARTAIEHLTGIVDAADSDTGDVEIPTLKEFLDVEEDPFDWVIPGLLERSDRLVLTGSEGLGKSELQRQIFVLTAAGLHPFTYARIPPQDVLVIDCENSGGKVRRKLRGLIAKVRASGGGDVYDHLRVICRPAGLDLTKPEDEAWLLRLVSQAQPALLVIGPIYRLHEEDPSDEKAARKVTQVLDRCRAAANCAVIIEAHSPLSSGAGGGPRPVRPIGSSLWLRWPEFGYGLRPTKDFDKQTRVVDFVAWRGDREEREWPQRLKAGGAWPWATAAWSEHNSWGA